METILIAEVNSWNIDNTYIQGYYNYLVKYSKNYFTWSTDRQLEIIEMQGPNDISRSREADPPYGTTVMFSLAALLIPVLFCVIFWMSMRCILGLREEYFNEGENKQQGRGQRCSALEIV